MARGDIAAGVSAGRGIPFRFTSGRRTFYVDLIGIIEVRAQLEGFRQACIAAGRIRSAVGSDLIYAFGQEYGHHPRGRLARRAGGAYYMRAGYDAVRSGGYDAKFARAVLRGQGDVQQTATEMERVMINRARATAPFKKGALRGSIRRRTT